MSDVRQGERSTPVGKRRAKSFDFPDRLLDVHEAAVLLSMKPGTLYQWAYERRIPVVKLSGNRGSLRFRLSTLLRLIENGERGTQVGKRRAKALEYPDRLLDVHEAAVLLSMKPATLYQWAYERRIPVVKLSGNHGSLRFRLSTLLRLIESSERPARGSAGGGEPRGLRGR